MKYKKYYKSSKYKKWCRKLKKKYFGKIRKRQVRIKLKDINFEIQNCDYKKLYKYGHLD